MFVHKEDVAAEEKSIFARISARKLNQSDGEEKTDIEKLDIFG